MALKDPVLAQYAAGILGAVPEADRGKVEARLIELEEGGLRQADYSKQSAEAQAAKKQFETLHAQNVDWFQTRQKDLQELDALRAKVADIKPADPDLGAGFKLPEGLITKKEVQELFDVTERGAVGFIAEANVLTLKHYQQFGEILNISDLLADPRVQQIGIQGVYQEKFKEQISTKAKAADDAKADALRKEGYDKARTELASRTHPYPVVGNEPSALDAIEAAVRSGDGKVSVKSLDDIAAEYARLGASRLGASP